MNISLNRHLSRRTFLRGAGITLGLPFLDAMRPVSGAAAAVAKAEHAQVLKYWLDASMFSKWTRPVVKLPWNAAICRADIAAYRALGIRHITTFATCLDADYVKLHGDPQPALDQYGAAFVR